MGKKKNRRGTKKDSRTLAERADKHELYEQAVQNVEAEIDFIDDTFRKMRKRRAVTLREDFCGTANTSCEWVRRRRDNRAWGVDLDPDVLDWGRDHNLAALKEDQAERLKLVKANVLNASTGPVDVVLAMNFSYWIFKDRKTMKQYFRKVRNSLAKDGIFFLDAFGGYEAYQELKEGTKHKTFTYFWEQEKYNPITGDITCHIHFKLKDGSKLKRAFTYEWRMWSLPELTEMLEESGFRTTVYWEGADEDGEGNGVFTPTTEGEADAGWIAYLVAEK